jgi:hypothetical protein
LNQYGNPQEEFLKCIETGSIPHYEITYQNNNFLNQIEEKEYYGAGFNSIKENITSEYSRYSALYQATADLPITGYEKLQNNVVKTVYANGVYTLVNYGDHPVNVDGHVVDSKNFIIVKG